MFKLDLDKAEEPEIKLPTSAGSWKKQESSRKKSISVLLTMPKPLTVWITLTVENSERISHCTCEIKTCLLLGRKVMTNLDSILKNRDITLPTKVHLEKAIVFPVVMYGCESWTIKKADRRRIDAFELWCWRKLLRVPWIARRSNQSILTEISPGYSLTKALA